MRTAANNAHIDFVPFQADGQAMADYIKRYGLEADWQGWLTKAGERVAYKIPAKDGRDFQVVWVDPAKREMVLNPVTRAARVKAAGTKGSASFTLTCEGVGDDSQNTMAGAYLAQDGFREFVIDYLKNLVSNAKFWKYDEDNTDPAGADGYMRIESVVMDYDNLTIEADFSAKIQGTATYEYATNSEFGNDEVRSAVWYALVHAIEDKVPGGDITIDRPVTARRRAQAADDTKFVEGLEALDEKIKELSAQRYGRDKGEKNRKSSESMKLALLKHVASWIKIAYDRGTFPYKHTNEVGQAILDNLDAPENITDAIMKYAKAEEDETSAKQKEIESMARKTAEGWLAQARKMTQGTATDSRKQISIFSGMSRRDTRRVVAAAAGGLDDLAKEAQKYATAEEFANAMFFGEDRNLSGAEKSILVYGRNVLPEMESVKHLEYVPVQGKPVKIIPGINTFISHYDGAYRVSEKETGLLLAMGKTAKEAQAAATEIMRKHAAELPALIESKQKQTSGRAKNEKPEGYFLLIPVPRNEWYADLNKEFESKGLPKVYGDRLEMLTGQPSPDVFALDKDLSRYLSAHPEVLEQFYNKVKQKGGQAPQKTDNAVNTHMDTAAVRVTAALQITKPGEGYSQEAIQSAIAGLKWEDYPADGKLPYTEGYAINAVRKEFNLPRPSKLALNGTIQPMNDKEGQHALYGINIPYKNADLILYIADTGTETFVVAKDEQWKGKDNEPATTAGKVEFLEVGDTVRFSYPGHSFEGKVGEIVDSDFKRTGVGVETVYQVKGEGIDPEDADSWATADELERVTAQKTTAATDSDWTFQHNAGSLTGATHKSGIEIKRVKTPSRKSRRGMEMGGVRWEVEMPNGTIYSTHSLESAQEYVEKTNRLTAQRTTASMQEMEVTGYQIRRGDQIAEKDGALWTVESVTIIGKQVRVVVRGDFLSARGEKTVSLRGDKKYKIVRDVKESDAVGTYEIDSKTGEHRKVGASVSAVATIRKEDDGYHVRSKDGKNLGGPYKTEEEAKDRLKQVETFKHKKAATAKAKPDDGPTDETYAVYGDSEFYRTGDHFYFSNEGRLVELTDDQADQLRAFLAKNTNIFKTEKEKVDALRKILIEDLGLIKRKMIELEMIAVKAKLQESHGDRVADLTRKVLSLARAVKSAYVGPTAVAIHPIADQIGVKARQVYNETHTDNWVTAAIDPMSRDPHSIRAKIDEIERDVRDLKLPLGLANVMANRLKDGLRELKKAIDNL